MKALIKLILPLITVLLSGCVDRTVYGPTRCLIDGVSYKSSPETISGPYWPGSQELNFYENGFSFYYARNLKSSNETARLCFKFKHDTPFEIGVEFAAGGHIYVSDLKYEITDGWVKFLDYQDKAQYGESYISGAFEFTAQSENGKVVKATEGFFDELPISSYTR